MAGKTHGTRTSERMNEALKRDLFGFIARQTKATQDFRQAIYLHPDGKIGHWVRNPYSAEPYWVADLTGGSTFEPGSTVMLASFSGRRGEGIVGRSPAGFGGAAISEVTLPPSVTPETTPAVPAFSQGYYQGWSFYCDGGPDIWLACFHVRFRYDSGPVFVDGQRFLRIAKLPVSSISGATELALDGYEIGEFLNGVGGTEQFRLADELMTGLSDPIPATYCIVQSGGVIFVVAGEFSSTSYSVICMTDSGEVIGSDYFTGRTPSSTTSDYMSINQAVVSPTDGGFYFAHPVGAGSEQFRFCKRSPTTGAIESYVDLDLNALGYEFASICPIPSASGVRIFGSQGSGLPCVYKDYDSSFSDLSGWVVMDGDLRGSQRRVLCLRKERLNGCWYLPDRQLGGLCFRGWRQSGHTLTAIQGPVFEPYPEWPSDLHEHRNLKNAFRRHNGLR